MTAPSLQQVLFVAIVAIPIVIAITFHEAAHGFVARHFGDSTAADRGRVPLNPLKHIDLFGTVLLPALLLLTHTGFIFGYAKPVPVRFSKLNNPKRDMIWVAAAGPAMNVLLALVSAAMLFIALAFKAPLDSTQVQLFRTSIDINLILAVLNMIPLPPLDGGRVAVGILPQPFSKVLARLNRFGMLLVLTLFILLPMAGINVFQWLVAGPVQFLERPLFALLGFTS